MTRERELECVIADLKAEIKDRHEDYQLLGKDFHAAMEWNRELREQLKTDQEPVAWMHETEGLSYENCYAGSVPLYTHPVVSSEPVFQVGFGWLKHDHVENGTLLYTAPPSSYLSDREIIDMWFAEYRKPDRGVMHEFAVKFARAMVLLAKLRDPTHYPKGGYSSDVTEEWDAMLEAWFGGEVK